jgi:hypothetical protein
MTSRLRSVPAFNGPLKPDFRTLFFVPGFNVLSQTFLHEILRLQAPWRARMADFAAARTAPYAKE